MVEYLNSINYLAIISIVLISIMIFKNTSKNKFYFILLITCFNIVIPCFTINISVYYLFFVYLAIFIFNIKDYKLETLLVVGFITGFIINQPLLGLSLSLILLEFVFIISFLKDSKYNVNVLTMFAIAIFISIATAFNKINVSYLIFILTFISCTQAYNIENINKVYTLNTYKKIVKNTGLNYTYLAISFYNKEIVDISKDEINEIISFLTIIKEDAFLVKVNDFNYIIAISNIKEKLGNNPNLVRKEIEDKIKEITRICNQRFLYPILSTTNSSFDVELETFDNIDEASVFGAVVFKNKKKRTIRDRIS